MLSLREPIDFKIVSLLLTEGPIPFSKLRTELQLEPTTLDRCLKRLMDGALLSNFYSKKEDCRAYSFYEATPLAQALFGFLIELGKPRSTIPVASNPFYQPGPEISDYLREILRLTEQMRKRYEMQTEKVRMV